MVFEMRNSLDDNLKKLRLERGLSQAELAQKVNLSQNAIFLFENGLRVPSLAASMQLADVFGCTLDNLVGRVPVPEEQ